MHKTARKYFQEIRKIPEHESSIKGCKLELAFYIK